MQTPRSTPVAPVRRQLVDVSLSSNFDVRYWMQVLGVSRFQLEEAVRSVGTRVDAVMDYLSIPERRHSPETEES